MSTAPFQIKVKLPCFGRRRIDPEQVSMVRRLIDMYGEDATLKQALDDILPSNLYKCPKCNGNGYTTEMYNAYPTNLPDSGWADDMRERKITCDVCGGEGYTETEMVPITKTTIVGYGPKR